MSLSAAYHEEYNKGEPITIAQQKAAHLRALRAALADGLRDAAEAFERETYWDYDLGYRVHGSERHITPDEWLRARAAVIKP